MRLSASLARRSVGAEEFALTKRRLTEAIVRLATRYGRYGYRRIRRLLLDEGWHGERQAGLSHLAARGAEGTKEATQARAALAQRRLVHPAAAGTGPITCGPTTSCRIAPRTGGRFRMLTVIDEFTHDDAWRSSWRASSRSDRRDSTALTICSSRAGHRSTFAPTTSYVRKCGIRSGNRSPSAEGGQRIQINVVQAASAVKEKLSAIANTGSTRYSGPHRPQHEMQIPGGRPEHYLQGRGCALTALLREVLPPGTGPSKKGR